MYYMIEAALKKILKHYSFFFFYKNHIDSKTQAIPKIIDNFGNQSDPHKLLGAFEIEVQSQTHQVVIKPTGFVVRVLI